MPLYDYAYSTTGWNSDAADFTNFEDVFTLPVLFAPQRLPKGEVVTKVASGHEIVDGWQTVVLRQPGDPYGVTLFEDLDDWVDDVFGGWDGEDAEISLRTDQLDGSYAYYNVIAHVPKIGTDYQHTDMQGSVYVRDLALRFTVFENYTPGDL